MGEAIDRLRDKMEDTVSLSMIARVAAYKRTTKTGKVVDVQAYVRTLRNMSNPDLKAELGKVSGDRTRTAQVVNELRRRESPGFAEKLDLKSASHADLIDAHDSAHSPERRSEILAEMDRRHNADIDKSVGSGKVDPRGLARVLNQNGHHADAKATTVAHNRLAGAHSPEDKKKAVSDFHAHLDRLSKHEHEGVRHAAKQLKANLTKHEAEY